ncbi:hypothetical protein AX14_006964 [Amanita brunnescens Koide BX004]|nr:hypothetical protein AX14_006964 [Amanita brunnescens Koide BX004]
MRKLPGSRVVSTGCKTGGVMVTEIICCTLKHAKASIAGLPVICIDVSDEAALEAEVAYDSVISPTPYIHHAAVIKAVIKEEVTNSPGLLAEFCSPAQVTLPHSTPTGKRPS